MKKRLFSKLNNAGNTLVIVLVVVAFMTVLGTVAVTGAMVGYKMKLVDKEVKRTFYSAEEVVDEIYNGLGMKTMSILQDSYMNILTNVTVDKLYNDENYGQMSYKEQVTNADANKMLREKFAEKLIAEFTGIAWSGSAEASITPVAGSNPDSDDDKFIELLDSFIETPELAKVVSVGNISIAKGGTDAKPVYTLRFTDCMVEYRTNNENDSTDMNTYYSRVTFDGVIDMDKYLNFSTDTINSLLEFEKFSIIGCQGVSLGNGATVSSSAGIYAGVNSSVATNVKTDGGLLLNDNSSLTVNYVEGKEFVPSVISKGRICVKDEAIFKTIVANVWCNDIFADGDNSNVNIDGDIFVLDDTEINGDNVNVTLSGNYYGFGADGYAIMSQEGVPNANSSAIIVNGSHTSVNLLGLESLLLAGRAYIDYSKVFAGGVAPNDYMLGQSIALKGNQEAYLVPEIYMKENGLVVNEDLNMNVEVDKTAYNSVGAGKKIIWKKSADDAGMVIFTPAPANQEYIEVGVGDNKVQHEKVVKILINEGNFFGYQYLNQANPFRIVAVGGRNYVYFNFRNSDSIKSYFDDIFNDSVDEGKSDEWKTGRAYMKKLLQNNVNELSQTAIINNSDQDMQLTANSTLVSGSLISSTVEDIRNEVEGYVGIFNGKEVSVGTLRSHSLDLFRRYELAYRALLVLPLTDTEGNRVLWSDIPDTIVNDEKLVDLRGAQVDGVTPFSYYINENKMNSYVDAVTMNKTIRNGSQIIYVNTNANENYLVPEEVTSGVIVTKGNVTVNGTFSGIIFAEGTVTVNGAVNLDNDATAVILDGNKELREIFKAYDPNRGSTNPEDDADYSDDEKLLNVKCEDLITFENWRKQSPTTYSSVLGGDEEPSGSDEEPTETPVDAE